MTPRSIPLRDLHWLLWLLAVLLPLQAVAPATLAAMGPLHTHREDGSMAHRQDAVETAAVDVVLAAFGRFHAHGSRTSAAAAGAGPLHEPHPHAPHPHADHSHELQRHHHAASDLSVVVDAADTVGDVEWSTSAALGAPAVPSRAANWAFRALDRLSPSHRGWVLAEFIPEVPRRPPRT